MGLRAGSSTAERGAWPRSLRGTIVAGPTPSRAHDNDCLCLPAASTSHQSEAGKKESTDHRLSQACPPCAELSSISLFDRRLIDARTANNGSAHPVFADEPRLRLSRRDAWPLAARAHTSRRA